LVCFHTHTYGDFDLTAASIDFLSVRKIPIRQHPYILADGSKALETDYPSTEDDVVNTFMFQIRQTVMTDRALHDKVAAFPKHDMRGHSHSLTGCQGICLLRSCILEA
jgi:hypothetical protein